MNQLNSIILEGTIITDPDVVAKSSVTGNRLLSVVVEKKVPTVEY